MKPIETIMRTAPVIPVLVIEDVVYARPIAEALVAGGLRVLEVTLRTAVGLEAIAATLLPALDCLEGIDPHRVDHDGAGATQVDLLVFARAVTSA
jgi:predicted nicotinamide N-methyase